tara:strand:- start:3435 stop:3779 length:345 start_codon:yes stop_codon:yes gene_type:complete
MPKKKPYFPNNWSKLVNVPAHYFDSLTFEEFMDWRIAGWELPSSIDCIIREENLKTGKIKEHVYSRQSAAKKRVMKIMTQCESEFVLASHDSIHHLYPKEIGQPYEEGEYDPNY